MDNTLKHQIEQIKMIHSHKILLKSISNIFQIEGIVDKVIKKYAQHDSKKLFRDLGNEIIDEIRSNSDYAFFERELKRICGFNEDDLIAGDIIFNFFSSKSDIEDLIKDLIDLAYSNSKM